MHTKYMTMSKLSSSITYLLLFLKLEVSFLTNVFSELEILSSSCFLLSSKSTNSMPVSGVWICFNRSPPFPLSCTNVGPYKLTK